MPDLSSFNLNLLVVFDAIMREGSVTQAAARLGVSQPAVSNSLRELRRIVGDPLFVRQGRGIVPTPRAEALAAEAGPALARIRGALLQGPFEPSTSTLVIQLETADYTELMLLPKIEARLAKEAPGLALVVRPSGSMAKPDAFESLIVGRCDLYINRVLDRPNGIHSEPLFEGNYACVARRGHPRVEGSLGLEAYLAERHLRIAVDEGYEGPIEAALGERGLSRRIAMSLPRFAAAPMIVAETDLIATLPARLAQRFAGMAGLQILPSPIELPSFTVDMLWAERTHASPAFRWFRSLVSAVCADF